MFLLLLHFSLAPLHGAPGLGESTADSLVSLPEITIVATREAHRSSRAPARIVRLEAEDAVASGARNLGELLTARSTAFVRHYGAGGLATVSLRGFGPTQTLLLVDGIRLTDPQTGQIDLSLLPSLVLESVEILHGAGSALYGSEGVTGVVNLSTVASGQRNAFALQAATAAFGERSASVRLDAGQGPWRLAATAEASRVRGDFPVPAVLARREDVRRDGADQALHSLYATARRSGGRHRFDVSGWFSTAERGLPGPVTTTPIGERQWDRQLRIWAVDRMSWRNVAFRFAAGTQLSEVRYRNPRLELDQTGTTATYFAESAATAGRGRLMITSGFSTDYSHAAHPARRNVGILHGAVFAAGSLDLDQIAFYPALRLDAFDAAATSQQLAVNPRMGLLAQIPGTDRLRLKSSIGRSFRSPTINERYWQPGGDPDLRPERGLHGDAGLVFVSRTIQIEASIFAASTRDEILWLMTPGGYYAASNVRRVRSVGAELSLDATRPLGGGALVSGGAVFTVTDARDRSDPDAPSFDHQLRYVPRTQAKAFGSLHAGMFAFDVNCRYGSRRFVTTDGTDWVPAYAVVDAQVRARREVAGVAVVGTIGLENVLDAEYAIVRYYPMPPRHLRFTLSIAGGF